MIPLRAADRERPAWAERIPQNRPDLHIVRCGGCGESMPWRTFLRHLRECPAAEGDW